MTKTTTDHPDGEGRHRFPLRYPQDWYEAFEAERLRQEGRSGAIGQHLSMNEALCRVLEKHVVRPHKEREKR